MILDAVEIEDAGFFEELEEDSENEEKRQKVINLEDEEPEQEDETWKSMYQNDRQKFGENAKTDLTEEEQQILSLLEQQPEDYIPFSDTSDKGDDENIADDISEPEEDQEMEIVSHKSSEEEGEEEAESQNPSMNEEMPEYPLLKNTKPIALKVTNKFLILAKFSI